MKTEYSDPLLTAWMARLLRTVSSRHAASAAVGDVVEELRQRQAAGRAPRWPWLWVNARIGAAVIGACVLAMPRAARALLLIGRDAFRSVARSPKHSFFVIAVLAVAMAAGTVTFSVVDAVMFKPLPFDHPERLVQIPSFDEAARKWRVTPEVFWRLHDNAASLESVTALSTQIGSSVTVGGITDELPLTNTLAESFRMFGLTPAIGRLWTTDDETRGETDVAVLGYRFWRQQLGGSPNVLGMRVTSGRRTFRVIGVLSAASDVPGVTWTSADVWVPTSLPRDGTQSVVNAIGKMKPGVLPSDVLVDLQRAADADTWHPDVKRLGDAYGTNIGRWMLAALGAAGLVVLIACVNAANLMLTRSTERLRETAVRASLGASVSRVAAGAIVEGLMLSFSAAAAAALFGAWAIGAARAALAAQRLGIARIAGVALNGRVFAAAAAAALLTGLMVAVVPAWQASRSSIVTLLKDASPTATGGRARWRGLFLVTEIAAVGVLLVGAWLFVTSLVHAVSVDLGVDRTRLVGLVPRMPFNGTVDDVVSTIRRVPSVTSVAVSTGAGLPIFGRVSGAWITTKVSRSDGTSPAIETLEYRVTPNYFEVAGLRFLRGGGWAADTIDNAVVIDERVAATAFGAADPIGKQLTVTEPAGVFTVTGVVPFVRARGPEEEIQPAAYFPLKPNAGRAFAHVLVRTDRDSRDVAPIIAQAVEPLRPRVKDEYIFAGYDAVRLITSARRFNAVIMFGFGLVGAVIGAVGIYAVMGSLVSQRTKEIGVRLALGATPRDIQRQVLGSTLRHVVVGLIIGFPAAWWFSRGLTAVLFQVTPADVSVYAGVATLLGAVALAAALVPSRRAARVDPIVSLRQ